MTRKSNTIVPQSKPHTDQVPSRSSTAGTYLVRLEVNVDPLPLMKWLKHQQCPTNIYWAGRQGDLEIAAAGLADSIDTSNTTSFAQALATMETRLPQSSPGIRYYGGHCFDPQNIDLSVWHGFGPYRFIVPEYEIVRTGNVYTLAQNTHVTPDTDMDQLERQLLEFRTACLIANQAQETIPDRNAAPQVSRQDIPSRAEWLSLAQQLVQSIQAGHLEKVVLAHQADLVFDSTFDPVTLLERVANISAQAYSFLFRFSDSAVFMGATPECLFQKDGREVYSEAIAGTRPIVHDRTINSALQAEFRQSAKDLQEHDYVADNINAALQTICAHVNSAEPRRIIQTALVQHLHTRFQGRLADHAGIYHIINALHPTAAVNGIPSAAAAHQIRSLEPFSRGWYAGPVGWIMSDRAEFAVAIRSALVQQERMISIYSGAGLVADSDPQEEWAETELKKGLLLQAVRDILC